ncbi:MAG: mannonate dehydratase [Terriglobia bacterium]
MFKPNRRECLQGILAAASAAAMPSISPARPAPHAAGGGDPGEEKIKICLVWGDRNPHLVKLSEQIGVTHAIAGTAYQLSRVPRSQYVDTVAKIKSDYEAAGLTIAGIESHPVPANKIKLGLPGRDEEIENYIAAIEALGKAGIPMVCYDFMAGIDWYRSNMHDPGRGGASTMSFNIQDAEKLGPTHWGRISKEKMWSNIEYFLKAVIPVAQKANVQMALHPDDPPVPVLRGISRIIVSPAAYRRVMSIVPSPVNGATFEMGVFSLFPGVDLKALAREFCRDKKVFYINARNLRGTRDNFTETFQDNGKTDFGEMFQTFYDNGFRGPLRPDHDPILDGEAEEAKLFHYPVHPGYGVTGKIFAVGYIKGIMASRHIPYV